MATKKPNVVKPPTKPAKPAPKAAAKPAAKAAAKPASKKKPARMS